MVIFGVVEYWSIGVLVFFTILQYSITPFNPFFNKQQRKKTWHLMNSLGWMPQRRPNW